MVETLIGGMMNARPLTLIAGLCILAAVLPLLSFELRDEPARGSGDYFDYDWSKGLVIPFRYAYQVVGTNEVVSENNPPSNTPLRLIVEGIYVRSNIPRAVAALGGLLIPYLLLCTAGFLSCQISSKRARSLIASAFVVAGAILLAPPCYLLYLALSFRTLPLLTRDAGTPPFLIMMTVGLTLLIGGISVLTRASRSKS
jgi:hypothetical protein